MEPWWPWFIAALLATTLLAGALLVRRRERRIRWRGALTRARVKRAAKRLQSMRDEMAALRAQVRSEREERGRFLATATHDLRQPIHAIGLFLGALDQAIEGGPARDIVNRMHRAMRGVDDLSHRLLDLARLDSGAIEPHISVFAPAPILGTLATRFEPLAKERRLRLRVRAHAGLYVRSDPTLVTEILMNLVSNAFRYTQRGGILIALRKRGSKAVLQVWDSGVGIAIENQARVFDEFVQVKEATDRTRFDARKGTGLGLAIVARLTEVVGGTAHLRSEPDRGSVFEICLPLVPAPARAAAPVRAAATAPTLIGTFVLVVDNHVDTLLAMESLLKSWGCYVLIGRTMTEALEHLARVERFPDMLVTDHHLAEETSVEVVAAVKDAIPIDLPVLVMSGANDAATRALVARHGWRFLAKPVNPDQLRIAIEAMAIRSSATP